MLRIANLEKKLGAFSLHIENLHITAPGIYGLIGPNGCGKSTTAKLISGVVKPDSGKIDIAFDRRNVTMVSPKPYMMDDTVYHNLIYPLKLRGIKPDHSVCNEYLTQAGLLEKQRARSLSAGERQKLALLRAFIFRPRLVILDEAMTDLDIDSLELFESMVLERQKREPVIWIIISHQLAHIRRLCSYIYFMAAGRLEAEGQAAELLASSNPLVRRYLKHELLESGGTERQ
jgi:ABC-type multidrug transport system ATPase subunit